MAIPVPEKRIARFEKLGFGMFIHWGLYSQLGKGEWIQEIGKIPKEEYIKLKDTFTAKDFSGREVARIAKRAGMKYITLTTRHHEGFSLYDTRGLNDYDAPHSAAGRDLIADLWKAAARKGFCLCFTTLRSIGTIPILTGILKNTSDISVAPLKYSAHNTER